MPTLHSKYLVGLGMLLVALEQDEQSLIGTAKVEKVVANRFRTFEERQLIVSEGKWTVCNLGCTWVPGSLNS